MKRLVEYPLADGGSILVEVEIDEEEQGGIVPAASPGEIAARATQTLEEALDRIKPAAGAVVKKLRELSDRPDEVEVTFGLKLTAEAGAIIAAAGIEANYTVTLKWTARDELPTNDK